MGNYSHELEYIQVVLMQTFVISFFMKYVPEFRFAKQDFIREHHGTVFRTRLEAVVSLWLLWSVFFFAYKIHFKF